MHYTDGSDYELLLQLFKNFKKKEKGGDLGLCDCTLSTVS